MHTLQALLGHARQVLRLAPGGATDAQLLKRFKAGDEAAFELLVWRHGPMILSVCRRVLGDEQAAEDAFQTTFFALAQKCGAIGGGEVVGAWLYRVAYRTALRVRLREARRAERERLAGLARAERTQPDPAERLSWEELRPRLDAEVARLPAEYRTAFILCHLEGKTNEEAARELGCPVGTIQSRLSRARARLRSRLRRQGLGPESIPFIFFIQRPQAPSRRSPGPRLHGGPIGAPLAGGPRRLAPPMRRRLACASGRGCAEPLLVLLVLLMLAMATAALAFGGGWLLAADASSAAADPACSGGCHMPERIP